jgi:hypothetical protein
VLESKSQGLKMERTELTPTIEEPPSFFNGSKLRQEVLFKIKKTSQKWFSTSVGQFHWALVLKPILTRRINYRH